MTADDSHTNPCLSSTPEILARSIFSTSPSTPFSSHVFSPRPFLGGLLFSSLLFSSLLFSSLGQKAFPCLQFLVRPSIRPGRFLFAAAGFLVFLLAPEILRGCCKSLRYGGSQGGGVDILPFLSGLNAECRWTFRRVEEGILPKVDILTNGELLHRTLLLFFLSFFLSFFLPLAEGCGG